MRDFKTLVFILILLSGICPYSNGQSNLPADFPKFEITANNSPENQYLFLGTRPTQVKFPAYLVVIDNYGTPVYYRYLTTASGGFSPETNNRMSFWSTGNEGSKFYMIDAYGEISDSISMVQYKLDNHDFVAMENGHYLVFGLDTRTTDMSAIVAGGKANASVSGCVIQELDENKNVVFEWNSWDHFQITDSYEDLTKSTIDLVHPNSLEIAQDGNILLIGRTMDEITKINRQTGEVMWRMGGKNNQFTFSNPEDQFSWPHDFRQISSDHYTLFDNGKNRIPAYSRGIEYIVDEVNKQVEKVWEYDAEKSVLSPSGGSTRRLPSGNTIIGYGGQVSRPAAIEVHPDGSKAFQLDFVGDLSSGRAVRSAWETSLFETSVDTIEFGEWDGYSDNALFNLGVKNNSAKAITINSYSTRTDGFYINKTFPFEIPANGQVTLPIVFFPSNINTGYIQDVLTLNSDINTDQLVQRISRQVQLSGTKEDKIAPAANIRLSSALQVPVDAVIEVKFSEPVRMLDNTDFTYLNVDSYITLKKGDASGDDIPFDAVINTDKNSIIITPESPLDHTQKYYVKVDGAYEDYSNNAGSQKEAVFTTVDLTAPEGNIVPTNGATNFTGSEITITYNEPVRKSDNSEITDSDLQSLILLKLNDSTGADVGFTATINAEKTIISIIPGAQLQSNTIYYVAVDSVFEDYYDNKTSAISSIFTTGDLFSSATELSSNKILVFPNPGNGLYKIQIPGSKSATLKVTDLSGRLFYNSLQPSISNFYLDLTNLADGVYILKIITDGSGTEHNIRLIKQHE